MIRDVRVDDYSKILSLNNGAVPHVNELNDKDLQYFNENASEFLVFTDNEDQVSGFLILLGPGLSYSSLNYRYFEDRYSTFLYVDRIVIAPNYYRHGLGSALYQHIFKAYPNILTACEVNIKPENPGSMQFHKSMGFSEIGQQKTENGNKIVSLQVRK